jgi:hypothetical protein
MIYEIAYITQHIRSSFLQGVTQPRLVVRSPKRILLDCLYLKMELIGCPETSITQYQSTLYNIEELTWKWHEKKKSVSTKGGLAEKRNGNLPV